MVLSRVELSCAFKRGGDTHRSLKDEAAARSIIALEAWQIRERCFREIVDFRIGGLELGQKTAVPVLDLAMSLEHAVKDLAMDCTGVVNDPGSSWRVGLERSGDAVTVAFGRQDDRAECSFADLAQASGRFLRGVVDEVTEICPDLLLNDEIERLFRASGAIYLGRDRFLRHNRAARMKQGRN